MLPAHGSDAEVSAAAANVATEEFTLRRRSRLSARSHHRIDAGRAEYPRALEREPACVNWRIHGCAERRQLIVRQRLAHDQKTRTGGRGPPCRAGVRAERARKSFPSARGRLMPISSRPRDSGRKFLARQRLKKGEAARRSRSGRRNAATMGRSAGKRSADPSSTRRHHLSA